MLLVSCGQLGAGSYNLANLPNQHEKIALLLPLHGAYSGPGIAIRNGFLAAYYAELQQSNQPITVKVYDTSKGKDIRKLYAEAVAEGAQIIIGPLKKTNVKLLAGRGRISVPTIALNFTQADFRPPALLFEFGISPLNEAVQVATKASQQNLSKALIIAPKAPWGQNIADAFSNRFQQSGGKIIDSLYFQPNQKLRYAIRELLQVDQSQARGKSLEKSLGENLTFVPQRRKDIDMIFLVAPANMARQIIPLLRFYYAGNLPVYATAMIYKGTPNRGYYNDMNGVKFTDIPWIYQNNHTSPIQTNIANYWPKSYHNNARLYALGLDAFMLSQNLKRLPSSPNNGMPGRTGQLFLGNNNWIVHKFIWAQFKNGVAKETS